MHRDTKKILRKIYDSGATFESTLNEKYSFDKINEVLWNEIPALNIPFKILNINLPSDNACVLNTL